MMQEELDNPAFRERMEQAALLPGHDPVRAAVVQRVAACGGEEGPAGREWLALLDEAERWKLALMTVPLPALLEERLLRIPETPLLPWWKRPVGEMFTPRRLSIAAALMLLIAAGWWGLLSLAAFREGRAVDRLALVAATLHAQLPQNAPAQRLDTSDAAAAEQWLKSRLNFPALMLNGHGITLTSAAVVQFDNASAALTRWQKEGHTYTLLEFVPASLGLASDFAKRTVDAVPSSPGAPCKVILWAEPNRGCGWVLVMDPGAPNTFTY